MSGADGRLWLGRSGKPLGSAAIRVQIEQRTKAAFGRAVWPHLFRDCAVTELVDLAPEEIRRLLQDWVKTSDRFTCPHGRPVVLSMTEEDLEKYFKRR